MKRDRAAAALAIVLVAGIVATAALLVQTAHLSRSLFQERELLRGEHDRLQDDWSALTLEESWLANHSRIDQRAREDLGLVPPGDSIQFVELEQ